MDITRMSDEKLAEKLADNFSPHGWEDVAKFVRLCVKDSQKELVEALSRIKKFKGNMDCEKVYEIIDKALALVEGKNGKK